MLLRGGGLLLVAVAAYAHLPRRPIRGGHRIDRVVIRKKRRELSLLSSGRVVKRYRVALGRAPTGPKRQEGDGRTPEGRYTLDYRNPLSKFHLALHVSYPEPRDQKRAAVRGVDPGGDIMIHGIRNGWGFLGRLHRLRDWTDGCIAVTNAEVEELWRVLADRTPVDIYP